MQVFQVSRSRQPIEVERDDLITLAEAARLSGRSLPVITSMLDRGRLPWYELEDVPGRRVRLTSRRAVLALPPPPSRRAAHSSPTRALGDGRQDER